MAESQVRIFVSSPSDLEHERALVKDIVDQLAQEYLPYFKLEAVLWEQEALTAAQSFQAGLLRPSACELVLVMLWTRLGTPLADDPYGGMTGTEWEFVDAVESSATSGQPEVLVYKKTTPRLIDITDVLATQEAVADRERLDAFFRTHFFNEDGSFRRAFRQFDSDRVLRELVEGQLRKLLNRRISAELGRRPGFSDWSDSPFRAWRPYTLGDEPIFVGREAETRELVARLNARRTDGRGLVLITGAAGVGKSSLVRAGLLPRLVRPFLFPGIAGCRWCLLTGEGPDPVADLAQALLAPSMLGTPLEGFGLGQAALQRLLETEPEVAARQVLAALTRLTGAPGQPAGPSEGRQQLALILDPLDGLFSEEALADPRTATFAAALAALATQDEVWVVATLRSDRLSQLPHLPALAELLDEQAWFPLTPPPPARIRQVLEIPARIAGIDYEGEADGGGHGLLELLETESIHLTHWPALLEPLLAELYERAQAAGGSEGEQHREPGTQRAGEAVARLSLRISDYRALGGVAGATLQRAAALWTGLDAAARGALPILCRALIALEGGTASRSVLRTGDLRPLYADPACTRLIEALVAARLVVTEGIEDPGEQVPSPQTDYSLTQGLLGLARDTRDEWRARLFPERATAAIVQGQTGLAPATEDTTGDPAVVTQWGDFRPTACLIHEALIHRWDPVRDWLADPDNRRDLQLRFQITRQARLWKRTDCNREYLLGEAGYAAARGFASAFPGELEPVERDFLAHSRDHLRYQRQRNHLARGVGLALVVLLFLASTAAFRAWEASSAATLNYSRSEINAANLAIIQGNTPVAVRLAWGAGRALPRAATDTLSRAFSANRLIAMVDTGSPNPNRPRLPGFSQDGSQLVTLTSGDAATLWELRDNRFVVDRQVATPARPIHTALIARGEGAAPLILGIGEEGVWRLPAQAGAAPDWPCGLPPGGTITLDPGQRYLALPTAAQGDDFGLCLLDLQRPGPPLWERPVHRREIRGISFAPDGQRLVTASRDGTALVLDTTTGAERLSLRPTGPQNRPLYRAIFDSTGQQVAISAADERVHIFGEDGSERMVLGEVTQGGRRVRIHQSVVRDLTFADRNRLLLAGDDEGQLVRWDLRTGGANVLGQHRLAIERVHLSPVADPRTGEHLVLTSSLDHTASLWGVQSGRQMAVFTHDAPVTHARFSTDGSRILTYSVQDGSARVWSVGHATPLAFHLPHDDRVSHLDIAPPPAALDANPNAFLIASGSVDGLVRVWRYDPTAPWAPPGEVWRLVGHQDRVRRVAFSPSGRQLASAAIDGSTRVWDMVTGGGCALTPAEPAPGSKPRAGATEAPAVEFYRAVFAPTGRWLLTASNDPAQPARLWDPAACRELPLPPALEQDAKRVQAVATATAPNGAQLAATGNDAGTLSVAAQAADGTWGLVCRPQRRQGAITDVAFAPDGRTLAAVGENGQGALIAITDGTAGLGCGEPRTLSAGTDTLYSVRFAPDGAALVTASQNGRAQVWDTHGRQIADLKGHSDRLYSAEFSRDGGWIVTASRDGGVRLWRRPTPERTRGRAGGDAPPTLDSFLLMEEDLGPARVARFTPDGNGIAVAYRQNEVILWRTWAEDRTPDPELAAQWGEERSLLALIREAARFRRDNGLDAPFAEGSRGE